MRRILHRSKQTGDTIVEVLISIAVVSSVLAGAFTVTQRSSQAVRSSQERSEMLQILQGQVELVRALAMKAPDTSAEIFKAYPVRPKYFCIDPSSPAIPVRQPGITSLDGPFDHYELPCRGIGPGKLYNIAVSYDATLDHHEVFKVYGAWDSLRGGRNTMQLSYRILPGKVQTP